jgi:hypothetical protein
METTEGRGVRAEGRHRRVATGEGLVEVITGTPGSHNRAGQLTRDRRAASTIAQLTVGVESTALTAVVGNLRFSIEAADLFVRMARACHHQGLRCRRRRSSATIATSLVTYLVTASSRSVSDSRHLVQALTDLWRVNAIGSHRRTQTVGRKLRNRDWNRQVGNGIRIGLCHIVQESKIAAYPDLIRAGSSRQNNGEGER